MRTFFLNEKKMNFWKKIFFQILKIWKSWKNNDFWRFGTKWRPACNSWGQTMSIYKVWGRSDEILNILKFEFFDFLCWQERDLSVAKREICLLPRKRSVCWQERDLSVGKRKICLWARERSGCWLERSVWWEEKDLYVGKRDLSVSKRETEGPARPRACELRTQPKIILLVAVRTANSANFSLIRESKGDPL